MTPAPNGKGGLWSAVLYGAFFTLGAFAMGELLEWTGLKNRTREPDNDAEDREE